MEGRSERTTGHLEAISMDRRTARERIDTSLVQRAQTGDDDAMASLLRLSRPLVERVVARRCWDSEMADDLTQSILLVVLTELSELRSAEAYVSWLQRIARNLCCKQTRRSACLQAAASRLLRQSLADVGAAAQQVDPEEAAVRGEIQAHLGAVVTSLPVRYRTAVVMRAVQGHTFDEIGETLGCRQELARLWYFRARRRLQQLCVTDEVLAPAVATHSAAWPPAVPW